MYLKKCYFVQEAILYIRVTYSTFKEKQVKSVYFEEDFFVVVVSGINIL